MMNLEEAYLRSQTGVSMSPVGADQFEITCKFNDGGPPDRFVIDGRDAAKDVYCQIVTRRLECGYIYRPSAAYATA